MVRTELLPAVTGFTLNAPVVFEGNPERLSVIELAPPEVVVLTVTLPFVFRATDNEGDDNASVKSAAGTLTVTVTLVLCVIVPPKSVPVTVTVKEDGVDAVVVIVSTEFAELPPGTLTEDGFKEHVVLAGQPLVLKLTVPVKPAIDDTVMVELPELPCVIVNEDGLDESEKSGVGELPQFGNLNEPM